MAARFLRTGLSRFLVWDTTRQWKVDPRIDQLPNQSRENLYTLITRHRGRETRIFGAQSKNKKTIDS